MLNAKVIYNENELSVSLPMVQPTGKIRLKKRSCFYEYGNPIAARKKEVCQSCYIEWQIGYDLLKNSENKDKTSLKNLNFFNYKGEEKYLYELSEILYYSFKKKYITADEIKKTYKQIRSINDADTFEEKEVITRTHPKEISINGLDYYKMTVSYPLLVHKFGSYEILAEIVIKEKQLAVGTQAMLYVCLPITSLKFNKNPIGRSLDKKEIAHWIIGKEEACLSLELFQVFGMLSPKHKFDVCAILKTLFPDILS